ncbi:MAG: pyruvate kinase [Lachnospiraceae bacterium]|jgi:pyruvate kinase|nr:pyruvate kinase [Lachnospiraceae bacterium]MCI1397658.1 pyruvate kinase [Lachnospiraceae bacterium]MCI1423098.1 pyruvate kinase [Lachnospiraceae bacterium]MCI1451921.1 pyruvate kinase [Lachnospiraceae bacterium]MDD5849808.1 pyruvate kinase [Bacillota bacterium]
MRKTKIICTLGPASNTKETIAELVKAGMNVARFNFSHGDHEEQKARLETLMAVRRELGIPVAALLDTKGPEIRLRDFKDGKVELKAGDHFTLTTEEILGDQNRVSISYKNLPHDVKPGGTILIDDGLIGLTVDSVTDTEINCTVKNGGPVSNHKGVNVPGADLSMPFISEQDRSDLIFGCKCGFDYVAASFTRTAEDIREMRYILCNNGGSRIKIIAKIESTQGVKNFDEILDAADGIMVARGDLGVEVPLEDVPILQKRMIKKAEKAGKICVTATQMLDSMIHNPRPTRAEATDVANAIYDGTTAIMLSGESANGKYPVEAVRTMARIAETTEKDIDFYGRMVKRNAEKPSTTDVTSAISHATVTVAHDIDADAIITVTISGGTALKLASFKPARQIIACTMDEQVARQMNLYFGVSPLIIKEEASADLLFEAAINEAKRAGFVKSGDQVVLTAGVPLGISGNTNMIRVVEVW